MPRKTDTRERVFEAADQLLEEGIRPTQQSVRERIGSGSLSTINAALNDWWQSLSLRLNRRNQHPELPDAVVVAANKLWDQALAYAHHSLERERATLIYQSQENAHLMNDLRSSYDQLQQQNTQLRQQLDDARTELNEKERTHNQYERSIIQLTSERDELKRQLKQTELMHDKAGHAHIDTQALLDAKVESKIFSNRIRELELNLSHKNAECEALKEQLSQQERESLKQVHRLEVVIAQQDARHEHTLSLLNDCNAERSLAQKKS